MMYGKFLIVAVLALLPASTVGFSTIAAPKRVVPGAGRRPDWEERGGGVSDFMKSDESSADLSGLRECPLTIWDSACESVASVQADARKAAKPVESFPKEIHADAETNAKGLDYFKENAEELRAMLEKEGCVWLRGFDVAKTVGGYRAVWEALGMVPCLDPIHSSGLRKFASERDGLYEEVNKPALRGHYIGLHQEATAKRTAAAAAFVCFKRATEGGGRFTVADGAAILADLPPATLQRLVDNGVRISVSNLDTPLKSDEGLGGALRGGLKDLVQNAVAPKFDMDLEMVWEADGKPGRLQAVEACEPPFNRHPVTGVPVWFCNAHNHLRYLRDRRPCAVPEVGMTEVFLGQDLQAVSEEDAEAIRDACEKNIVSLPMEPGDVLLIDNYRTLHGRETFQGDRYHAVTWFTWEDGVLGKSEWRKGAAEGTETKDGLNKVLNKYLDLLGVTEFKSK